MKIKLNEKYQDEVTGFTGTATAKYEYTTGCIRYLLEGTDSDGDPAEFVADEERLRQPDGSRPQTSGNTGGAYPTPQRPSPSR